MNWLKASGVTERRATVVAALLMSLSACGGGGGGGDSGGPGGNGSGDNPLPPSAAAGADQTVSSEDTVQLRGSDSHDSDGSIVTFAWTQTGGSPVVSLSGANTANLTFVAPAAGESPIQLTFRLTVTDNDGLSASDTVLVTVEIEDGGGDQIPPTAAAGADQVVSSGDAVQLNGLESYDDDGNVVTFEWTQVSGSPAVSLSGADSVSPTFVAPAAGESPILLTFQLTVTDDDGLRASDAVVVTVAGAPTPGGFGVLGDIHPGFESSDPKQFLVVGDKTFFVANDGEHGEELWVTDGTAVGTRLVKDIRPGEDDAFIARLTAFNGRVVFVASDGTTFGALWISDGAEGGTQLVKDIATTSEHIIFVGVAGSRVYFAANDGVHGQELWSSDGTPDGTSMVADINPGAGGTYIKQHLAWNGRLYFYGVDDAPVNQTFSDFFVTEGSGVVRLTPDDASPPDSVLLHNDLIVFKDRLYFTWRTQADSKELWATDGTPGGTHLFADLDPGHRSPPQQGGYDGWPRNFHVLGDSMLFFAYTPFGNFTRVALWRTDGSTTEVVTQVEPGPLMEQMAEMNGRYYFPGRAYPATDFTLWTTDGTTAGSSLVSTVIPDSDFSEQVAVIGDKLVFQGDDGVSGYEPWVSDGTTEGTQLLRDIYPGDMDSYRQLDVSGNIRARGDKAYFIARLTEDDFHLFETDGTEVGTQIIAPPDANVTVNPMGQPVFVGTAGRAAPVLMGDTLLVACNYYANTGTELCKL